MADISTRESTRLIASNKVEGTSVRRSDGDKIGTIDRVMIDKQSGKVAYAVMSFGGFLGMGEDYHAIPWSALHYNPTLNAYEMNVTDDQLRNAPPVSKNFFDGEVIDQRWEDDIHRHYRAAPYW